MFALLLAFTLLITSQNLISSIMIGQSNTKLNAILMRGGSSALGGEYSIFSSIFFI